MHNAQLAWLTVAYDLYFHYYFVPFSNFCKNLWQLFEKSPSGQNSRKSNKLRHHGTLFAEVVNCLSKAVTRIYFRGCLGDETARPVGPRRGCGSCRGGHPPPHQLGECCKLPQWGPGAKPQPKRILAHFQACRRHLLEAVFVTRTVLATLFLWQKLLPGDVFYRLGNACVDVTKWQSTVPTA